MEGVDAKAMAAQWKQMGDSSNAAMAQILGGKPGASDAMAQMAKEVAKLKGTRVMEITSMGGVGPAGAPGTAGAPPPAGAPPSGSSVGGQIAGDTANQTAAGETSKESGKMGIFGTSLANSTLSAFHRKKATPPPAPAPAAAATPAGSGAAGTQTVVLMSTTTQKTNFSEEPIPLSVFQVPTGFKKVESPMAQMAK